MGQAIAVIYTNHLEKDVEDVWWRETKEQKKDERGGHSGGERFINEKLKRLCAEECAICCWHKL